MEKMAFYIRIIIFITKRFLRKIMSVENASIEISEGVMENISIDGLIGVGNCTITSFDERGNMKVRNRGRTTFSAI